MSYPSAKPTARSPLLITVPGLNNSGPGHWQSLWEQSRDPIARAELGMWDTPRRNQWVTQLDHRIWQADAPIILIAHSLGCLAVAWWAEMAGQWPNWPVAGALLVAPPDVDSRACDRRLFSFAPSPRKPLPFRSILIASEDDPYSAIDRSEAMARQWGSAFINAGRLGHINADSGLGTWEQGQEWLDGLITTVEAGPRAPVRIDAQGRVERNHASFSDRPPAGFNA